jgi:hypothetical protein
VRKAPAAEIATTIRPIAKTLDGVQTHASGAGGPLSVIVEHPHLSPRLAPVAAAKKRSGIGSRVNDSRFIRGGRLNVPEPLYGFVGTDFNSRPLSDSFQLLPALVLAWICGPNQALLTAAYNRLGSRESCEMWFASQPWKCGPSMLQVLRLRDEKANAPLRVPIHTVGLGVGIPHFSRKSAMSQRRLLGFALFLLPDADLEVLLLGFLERLVIVARHGIAKILIYISAFR